MRGMFGCLTLDMQAMSESICKAQDIAKVPYSNEHTLFKYIFVLT